MLVAGSICCATRPPSFFEKGHGYETEQRQEEEEEEEEDGGL
jgi:hypothetical protein